jgi:hypothetical protein
MTDIDVVFNGGMGMTKVKSKQEIVDSIEHYEKDLHKIKKMLLEDDAKRKDMKELYVFKRENNGGYMKLEYMFKQKWKLESKIQTLKWVLGQWE